MLYTPTALCPTYEPDGCAKLGPIGSNSTAENSTCTPGFLLSDTLDDLEKEPCSTPSSHSHSLVEQLEPNHRILGSGRLRGNANYVGSTSAARGCHAGPQATRRPYSTESAGD